jgi:hypothetical protein
VLFGMICLVLFEVVLKLLWSCFVGFTLGVIFGVAW